MNKLLKCFGCGWKIVRRFVKCATCHRLICLPCFAKGFEKYPHTNDHPYEVYNYDFPLFEPAWKVEKELDLLECINIYGYGNWQEVAGSMSKDGRHGDVTAEICEEHYNKYYLIHTHPLMPACGVNPPRRQNGTARVLDTTGYSAARSEFSVEYNDHAELVLRDLEFDSFEREGHDSEDDLNLLYYEIQLAVTDVYRNVLKERWRWKKKVADFGLININKTLAESRRYEGVLGHQVVKLMKAMSRFLSPKQWEFHLQSLLLARKTKQETEKLQIYRMNGIRKKRRVEIFERALKSRRETALKMNDKSKSNPRALKKNVLEVLSENIRLTKRPRVPLDISEAPGVTLLTEAEKEFCSTVRIIPNSYLDFRRILTGEFSKHGSLRLSRARALLKIDVNKTRKIYDFLIKEKMISCNEFNRVNRKMKTSMENLYPPSSTDNKKSELCYGRMAENGLSAFS